MSCSRTQRNDANVQLNILKLKVELSMEAVFALHAGGSDFRHYDGSDLKIYLLMRWLLSGPQGCTCWIYFVQVKVQM